jgi:hypothetical protein
MAIIAKSTSQVEPKDRGNVSSAAAVVQKDHLANTSAVLKYCVAPVTGKLMFADAQASITSDATKTYTFVLTNVSASKTMSTTTLFDADPVLTAGTKGTINLSTTAANVAVTRGDLISISMAGGTGSGLTCTALYFEEQ